MTQTKQGRPLTRGERIKHLRVAMGSLLNGVPNQADFGAMVAEEERREKGYNASTVHRWEEKDAAPDLAAIEAMARLAAAYGVQYASRAWIAFGDDGVAEARRAPDAPPLRSFPGGKIRLADPATFTEITASAKPARGAGAR